MEAAHHPAVVAVVAVADCSHSHWPRGSQQVVEDIAGRTPDPRIPAGTPAEVGRPAYQVEGVEAVAVVGRRDDRIEQREHRRIDLA